MSYIPGLLDPLPPAEAPCSPALVVRAALDARGWNRCDLADALHDGHLPALVSWETIADAVLDTLRGKEPPLWLLPAIAALPPVEPAAPSAEALAGGRPSAEVVAPPRGTPSIRWESAADPASVLDAPVVGPSPTELRPPAVDLSSRTLGQCVCGHGHSFTRCPNYGSVAVRCYHKDCPCTGYVERDAAKPWPAPAASRSDAVPLPRKVVQQIRTLFEDAESVGQGLVLPEDFTEGDRARLLVTLDSALRVR